MAKIENNAKKAPARRLYEVQLSFSGLERGAVFAQDRDDTAWAEQFVASGYLRDLGEEEPDGQRSEIGQR